MKHLDRVTEITRLEERIEALEYAIENIRGRRDKAVCLEVMLDEYTDRLSYLNGPKEYMVHFVGGGWNTCCGQDQESAFANALLEYPGDNVHLVVQNVTLASAAGKEAAMRLFY